jgi:hypothetical protein
MWNCSFKELSILSSTDTICHHIWSNYVLNYNCGPNADINEILVEMESIKHYEGWRLWRLVFPTYSSVHSISNTSHINSFVQKPLIVLVSYTFYSLLLNDARLSASWLYPLYKFYTKRYNCTSCCEHHSELQEMPQHSQWASMNSIQHWFSLTNLCWYLPVPFRWRCTANMSIEENLHTHADTSLMQFQHFQITKAIHETYIIMLRIS